jgi:hypothetical protein
MADRPFWVKLHPCKIINFTEARLENIGAILSLKGTPSSTNVPKFANFGK